MLVGELGTVEGPFQISGLDYSGQRVGEATSDMSLESRVGGSIAVQRRF
jgi:predicted secreted protein